MYWVQGFVEVSGGAPPTAEQWNVIKEHLNLCFKHMDAPECPSQPKQASTPSLLDVLGRHPTLYC